MHNVAFALFKGDLFISLCREEPIMRKRQKENKLVSIYRGIVSVFLCNNLMADEQLNEKIILLDETGIVARGWYF